MSSEIMIATATVSPKLWKKRPTRPAMKATGRKMMTSETVVEPHGVERGLDEARLVADDLHLDVVGERALQARQLPLYPVDHRNRVGARLLTDDELDRVLAVQARERARLDHPVLGIAQVAHAQRPVAQVRDDQLV